MVLNQGRLCHLLSRIPRTQGNVRGQMSFTLGGGEFYLHLVGRGLGMVLSYYSMHDSPNKNYWPQISLMRGWRAVV